MNYIEVGFEMKLSENDIDIHIIKYVFFLLLVHKEPGRWYCESYVHRCPVCRSCLEKLSAFSFILNLSGMKIISEKMKIFDEIVFFIVLNYEDIQFVLEPIFFPIITRHFWCILTIYGWLTV